MPRLTLKMVNDAIRARDIDAELVRGNGYHYFVGYDVSMAFSSMVLTPRLNDLTLDEWMTELDERLDPEAKCAPPLTEARRHV